MKLKKQGGDSVCKLSTEKDSKDKIWERFSSYLYLRMNSQQYTLPLPNSFIFINLNSLIATAKANKFGSSAITLKICDGLEELLKTNKFVVLIQYFIKKKATAFKTKKVQIIMEAFEKQYPKSQSFCVGVINECIEIKWKNLLTKVFAENLDIPAENIDFKGSYLIGDFFNINVKKVVRIIESDKFFNLNQKEMVKPPITIIDLHQEPLQCKPLLTPEKFSFDETPILTEIFDGKLKILLKANYELGKNVNYLFNLFSEREINNQSGSDTSSLKLTKDLEEAYHSLRLQNNPAVKNDQNSGSKTALAKEDGKTEKEPENNCLSVNKAKILKATSEQKFDAYSQEKKSIFELVAVNKKYELLLRKRLFSQSSETPDKHICCINKMSNIQDQNNK